MPVFTPNVPPCTAAVLTLTADGDQGDFSGMSHDGTYLVLTNKGGQACTVPGLPTVVMKDAKGTALPAARKGPVGMHPGPAVVPVRIEPGASVRTGVRWVSGEVYDKSRCVDPAQVEVSFGEQVVKGAMSGHLCGEAGKPVAFEQSPLQKAP